MAITDYFAQNVSWNMFVFSSFLNVNFRFSNEHHAGGTSQCSMGGGSSELPPTSPGYTESHLFIHEFMNCPLNLRDNRHTYSDLLDVSSHEHTN